MNQGTLVVFNLDSSVTRDDLRQIFGIYGEIKEVMQLLCSHNVMALVLISSFFLYVMVKLILMLILNLILQIRETPHKHHHKFIEFYDVRAAEAALRALNRSDIAGKKIKLEPSRAGGARRWYYTNKLTFAPTFLDM